MVDQHDAPHETGPAGTDPGENENTIESEPADRSSGDGDSASGAAEGADPERSVTARLEEIQERLDRTADELRAGDGTRYVRSVVRDYPILCVLGAAGLGALIARCARSASGGGAGLEPDVSDRSGPRSAERRAGFEDPGGGDEDPSDRTTDSDPSGQRGSRVRRELGDLIKESAQAALLTVLTRKLNDWLGPDSRSE